MIDRGPRPKTARQAHAELEACMEHIQAAKIAIDGPPPALELPLPIAASYHVHAAEWAAKRLFQILAVILPEEPEESETP